jgi:hypothetical protein
MWDGRSRPRHLLADLHHTLPAARIVAGPAFQAAPWGRTRCGVSSTTAVSHPRAYAEVVTSPTAASALGGHAQRAWAAVGTVNQWGGARHRQRLATQSFVERAAKGCNLVADLRVVVRGVASAALRPCRLRSPLRGVLRHAGVDPLARGPWRDGGA